MNPEGTDHTLSSVSGNSNTSRIEGEHCISTSLHSWGKCPGGYISGGGVGGWGVVVLSCHHLGSMQGP